MITHLPTSPENTEWFNVGGQKVFPLYGSDGGLTTSHMAWLVKEEDGKWFGASIRIDFRDSQSELRNKIKEAVLRFEPFTQDGQLPIHKE